MNQERAKLILVHSSASVRQRCSQWLAGLGDVVRFPSLQAMSVSQVQKPDLLIFGISQAGEVNDPKIRTFLAQAGFPILAVVSPELPNLDELMRHSSPRITWFRSADLENTGDEPAALAFVQACERRLKGRVKAIEKSPALTSKPPLSAAGLRSLVKESREVAREAVPEFRPPRLIVIGVSTGGPDALLALLPAFPADCPPTLIVQHMRDGFIAQLIDGLKEVCACKVGEAFEGAPIKAGQIWIAPAARHLVVRPGGSGVVCSIVDDPPRNHHRPSVDVLFESVAQWVGASALGMILTGMGDDGAAGLLALRNQGGQTIAQDRLGCCVFGMPRAAIDRGAAQVVLRLEEIASHLFGHRA